MISEIKDCINAFTNYEKIVLYSFLSHKKRQKYPYKLKGKKNTHTE